MKYSKETKAYIRSIRNALTARHGEVKEEWEILLNLLADDSEQYALCLASLEKYGVYDPQTKLKNPLLATLKDLQATQLKIIQQLGISPWAASKIKITETDDTDDFITSLTGGSSPE